MSNSLDFKNNFLVYRKILQNKGTQNKTNISIVKNINMNNSCIIGVIGQGESYIFIQKNFFLI